MGWWTVLETFRFFVASTALGLRRVFLNATVEAEYGDEVVRGKHATLAHHGPRSGNLPPCLVGGVRIGRGSYVGLSHVDLDALGGVMRLSGYIPATYAEQAFWAIAARVDTQGPHRIAEIVEDVYFQNSSELTRGNMSLAQDMLNAWWAWSTENRCFPPRDGSAGDCTEYVLKAVDILRQIFSGNRTLLQKGEDFAGEEKLLNEGSFLVTILVNGIKVVIRKAAAFTNHLYSHRGAVADLCLTLDTRRGTITLSRESDSVPVDCCEFVQSVWGKEARGHTGIAGGPRTGGFNEHDLHVVAGRLKAYLKEGSPTSQLD